MSERNEDAIRRFLSKDANRVARQEELEDDITQRVGEVVREKIALYHAEAQALLPVAKLRLEDTVKPWWKEFRSSGHYHALRNWIRQREAGSVSIASVVFPDVPKNTSGYSYAIGEAVKARASGDEELAVAKEVEILSAVGRDNLWSAWFHIQGEPKPEESHGLRIDRSPIGGGGFAFALGRDRYAVPLRYGEADELLGKVHPEVILGFADVIAEGKIEGNILASLEAHDKPRRVIQSGSPEHLEEINARAQEYYRRKQERGLGE